MVKIGSEICIKTYDSVSSSSDIRDLVKSDGVASRLLILNNQRKSLTYE